MTEVLIQESPEAGPDTLCARDALGLSTPAMVICERSLRRSVTRISNCCATANVQPIYSIKALSFPAVVERICPFVSGLAVCSAFEAGLARRSVDRSMPLHITSPGFTAEQFVGLVGQSDYISFNSLSQYRNHAPSFAGCPLLGIRVNPGISFVADERYDPCRAHSKLGVPIADLIAQWPSLIDGCSSVSGLHFHNNCEGRDFGPLLKTVAHISKTCGPMLGNVRWINLGGGYLFNSADALDDFTAAVGLLRNRRSLEVFIEPGAAFVREAGSLVSTVVDLISRDGKEVAVLDTSVNHWPEVFEYQFEPDVEGHVDDGRFTYLLAGCSCLAGDLFGVYSFEEPLEVGSRVVFRNAGAYSIVKANMFNGINLPNIYMLTEDGKLVLVKRFTYEDFASRCGVDTRATVGT